MTNESFDKRAFLVHSRFRQTRLAGAGRGLWEHWDWSHGSFTASSYMLIVMFFLEPTLWDVPWPPAPFNLTIPNPVALSLLLLPLLTGWLLDQYLSLKTPDEASFPRWLLSLRFLAASLPLLELYVLPGWRAFLLHRASRKLKSHHRIAHLNLSRVRGSLPSGLRVRRLYESGFSIAAAVSWFPLLIFWACWLANTPTLGPHHRVAILGTCVVLHATFFASTAHITHLGLKESRSAGWKRLLAYGVLLCGFLPLPLAMLGFAVPVSLESSRNILVWSAYTRRAEAARLPLWTRVQGAMRDRWQRLPWFLQWRRPAGLKAPERATQSDAERTALYRLKALLLLLDGAALFIGLSALAARVSQLMVKIGLLFHWVALISIALAFTGLIIQSIGSLAHLLRILRLADGLNHHPYGRYLLLTQLALLAGIEGAFLVGAGKVEQFGILLFWSADLCGLYVGLRLIMQSSAPSSNLSLWGCLFMAVSCLGGLIYLDVGNRQQLVHLLYILTLLAPLWSLGLFLALGGWLLRPFSWWHVFDRRLPRRLRAVLAFVALTAALPLGGLAIPFWIFARHRLWPQYVPLLSKNIT